MQTLFPPGITAWDKSKTKSNWREFAFALHVIQQAIDPTVLLDDIFKNWHSITRALAESSRERDPQISEYDFA